jgi:hypothetical protein
MMSEFLTLVSITSTAFWVQKSCRLLEKVEASEELVASVFSVEKWRQNVLPKRSTYLPDYM